MSAAKPKNFVEMGKNGGPESRARARDLRVLSKSADLLDLMNDKKAAEAVRVLEAGLKADKTFWDRETDQWITQPDFKERRENALAYLGYRFGKPIERQIVASGTFQELSEILGRINASSEARRELADIMPSNLPKLEKP